MNQLLLFVPAFIACGLTFGLFAVWISLHRRRARAEARRHPMKEPLLRPPGYSLRRRAEDELSEPLLCMMTAPLVVVMVLALHAGQTAYLGYEESVTRVAVSAAFVVAATLWLLAQARRHLIEYRNFRLGWEGDLAVAEALQPLAACGFRIFHDFPANDFNIDHVVVGPSGVFAVETKTRIKKGTADDAYRVIYDGKMLRFPDFVADKHLIQARAQARWLNDFLSSAVGRSIPVQPVLCIPGWWVDRKQRGDVVVESAKGCDKYFDGAHQTKRLDEQTVRMVAHQLEQKCRDVALGDKLL